MPWSLPYPALIPIRESSHTRYPRFFEYGDVESYRKGLERLRDELQRDSEDNSRR